MLFCSCDLDHDPMTLIYELDLKIMKIYLHSENEFSRSRLSKVRASQRDRHNWEVENIIIPHSWLIMTITTSTLIVKRPSRKTSGWVEVSRRWWRLVTTVRRRQLVVQRSHHAAWASSDVAASCLDAVRAIRHSMTSLSTSITTFCKHKLVALCHMVDVIQPRDVFCVWIYQLT